MSDSMARRVESAIIAAIQDEGNGNATVEKENGKWWITGQIGFDASRVARAAIEAMREPTERMIKHRMKGTSERDTIINWKMMIETALKSPSDGA